MINSLKSRGELTVVKLICFFIAVGTSTAINVAVIGGGIGGASSAYFLKQMHNGQINLDIYEANKVGGRLATVEYDGNVYENGGSIIHEKNLYMSKFVEDFGLEKKGDCNQNFAIFNGPELLFQSSDYEILTGLKFLWKYGLDIFRLDMFVKKMLGSFSRVYDLDKCKDYPFETTYEVLDHIHSDFLSLLNISSHDGFQNAGFSEDFVREIIGPIIQCNYCQSTRIHHFVGSVAVAGSGSKLWSVKGGNWQVADRLISASDAELINDRVISLSPAEHSRKIVLSTKIVNKLYDYVIVAAPLTEKNKIDLRGFGQGKFVPDKFHTTVCTFVNGAINKTYFQTYGDVPDTVLFSPGFIVNALAKVNNVNGDCNSTSQVWKIFSDKKLRNLDLNLLFFSHSVISVTEWQAYPEYTSHSRNRSFYLFENVTNLLYVNAIETLASAMEMSVIGAHNVASLVAQEIGSKSSFEFVSHDEL